METRTRTTLEELAKRACEAGGVELYHLDSPSGRNAMLRVFITRPGGAVSHEDCVRVSRHFGTLLDVEDAVAASYVLEVSSPGLDRRLYERGHFEAATGEEIAVRTFAPVEGSRRFDGRLLRVTPEGDIVLDADGREARIALSNVARANVKFQTKDIRGTSS